MKRKSMIFNIVIPICFALFFVLPACAEYGHEYHLTVTGGNGTLYAVWGDSAPENETKYEGPTFSLRDGKGTNVGLKFIAVPDEGYRVKEWRCNGLSFDTQSEVFYLPETVYAGVVYIGVEFEIDLNN